MVASKSLQRPTIAPTVPDGTKAESRVKRFSRWLRTDRITEDVSLLPYAEVLLAHLALPTLVLVMDGRVVGRGGIALMRHVVSQGRALPLAWLVRHGTKGHFPEDLPIALVKQVQALLPQGAQVVLLGDGACDGTDLLHTVHEAGWSSVCRTGCPMTASWQGATFRLDPVGWWSKPGTLVDFPEAFFTRDAYGPLRLLCCWAKGYQEPLYVVSTMTSAAEAWRLDAKRCRIETFFSEQTRRGFSLHTSHIAAPNRLSRL